MLAAHAQDVGVGGDAFRVQSGLDTADGVLQLGVRQDGALLTQNVLRTPLVEAANGLALLITVNEANAGGDFGIVVVDAGHFQSLGVAHHGVKGEIGHGHRHVLGNGVQIVAVHQAALGGQLLDVAVHEAAAEHPLAGLGLIAGFFDLAEDLVHGVVLGTGEVQERGRQGITGMGRVHMGVVGTGQYQLAAGIDDLGIGSDVGFHLCGGTTVNDPALPHCDSLHISEVLVYRCDFTVFQD